MRTQALGDEANADGAAPLPKRTGTTAPAQGVDKAAAAAILCPTVEALAAQQSPQKQPAMSV